MGPLAQDVIVCIAQNSARSYTCTCRLSILAVSSVTLILVKLLLGNLCYLVLAYLQRSHPLPLILSSSCGCPITTALRGDVQHMHIFLSFSHFALHCWLSQTLAPWWCFRLAVWVSTSNISSRDVAFRKASVASASSERSVIAKIIFDEVQRTIFQKSGGSSAQRLQ